jgi:hypothetical protein
MVCWLAGVLAVLMAACGTLNPSHNSGCSYAIIVRQFPTCMELIRWDIPPDNRFSLSFIHSVSGTPVRDDYEVVDGLIIQVASVFETHEAGLPSLEQEPDAINWEYHDGRFLLRLRRPISQLVMRTDRRYHNRLTLNTVIHDLNQWDDQALELVIEPCSNRIH